ncbi:MAG: efflux RND transporter periplasmic adaptor subunit [Burkholderiaceae bacterium]|nr:efflux RND transporter periplasmic adaptor subunit [Burkholderiaceae bacterium]
MKRWIVWMAAAIVVALIAAGAWRALSQRKIQQQALAAAAQPAAPVMEIAPSEIWPVRRLDLTLEVPVSGALRALQSATIKARIAGELQGLTLREGDTVRAGQEVAHIDPTESHARLRQAQQQADAARAQVAINQRQLDNNRALVDQGFISRTALETAQSSLQAAQSTYEAALAAADVAHKALVDTVLRSPINGQVAQRLVQNGERVALETRILEVVDLSRFEVEALLAPADAVAVRVGQTARLQIEGSSETLQASVARINPSAQAGSRAVPVYLLIHSTSPVLRQGLFVQGSLDAGASKRLAVPLEAVRTDKPAPYVQVAENNRVVHRHVQLGARSTVQGQTLVALEGLPEGALVLAGRVGTLPEGTALRLPSAAPAKP